MITVAPILGEDRVDVRAALLRSGQLPLVAVISWPLKYSCSDLT